jgi:hypothetical protein
MAVKIMDAIANDFYDPEIEYMTRDASKRFIEGNYTHVRECGKIYTAHFVQHDGWVEVYVGEELSDGG